MGTPTQLAKSGAVLDIDEGVAGIGAITVMFRWRARRFQRVLWPVGYRSEYLGIVPRAHLRPRAPGVTDDQHQPSTRADPE
jgi:hypothetical protein